MNIRDYERSWIDWVVAEYTRIAGSPDDLRLQMVFDRDRDPQESDRPGIPVADDAPADRIRRGLMLQATPARVVV